MTPLIITAPRSLSLSFAFIIVHYLYLINTIIIFVKIIVASWYYLANLGSFVDMNIRPQDCIFNEDYKKLINDGWMIHKQESVWHVNS